MNDNAYGFKIPAPASDKSGVPVIVDQKPPPPISSAQALAFSNFQRNVDALKGGHSCLSPDILEKQDRPPSCEFVLARDQTLSARIDERWWSGCSVPCLAAEKMLRRLDVKGAVGCFLAPTHSAQLQVALEILRPEQAIVAAIPDPQDLRRMLYCSDLSRDIAAHRLWFCSGANWEHQLAELFDEQTGLATPAQFIRLPISEEDLISSMIQRAQETFSQVARKRSAAMQEIRNRAPQEAIAQLCVVAPSQFRLWNDVGGAMLQAMGEARFVHFDPDDPMCSSPLAFAKIAGNCSTVLTANTFRSDLPNVLPPRTAWITWVTMPRISACRDAANKDRLLLCDPSLREIALKQGWPADRMTVACWPSIVTALAGDGLAIICDTRAPSQPDDLKDYSSHGLLWDFIADEISKSAFCVGEDVSAYLATRMQRFDISDDGFRRADFIDRLIVPAYQQSIARMLIKAGIPLRLFGAGWDHAPDLSAHWAGAVRSRDELRPALQSVRAAINVWPVRWPHPIESCGLPIVPRAGGNEALLRAAKAALTGVAAPKSKGPPLSYSLISSLLDSCWAAKRSPPNSCHASSMPDNA